MAGAHRQNDERKCGATTVVVGQNSVWCNGKLWAVQNDLDTHGSGQLINSGTTVLINGKPVIIQNDSAQPDNKCPTDGGDHCNPIATGCSTNVFAYG